MQALFPEIVEDGVTGFIVPPNDPIAIREKIDYLVKNPDIADEIGKKGREKILRQFTWDAVAERCLDIYGHKR